MSNFFFGPYRWDGHFYPPNPEVPCIICEANTASLCLFCHGGNAYGTCIIGGVFGTLDRVHLHCALVMRELFDAVNYGDIL